MTARGAIVVTGASRGIGRGIMEFAASRGLGVAACARSAFEAPEGVLTGQADVRDPVAVEAFCARAVDRFGRLDCWINNAGILEPIRFAHDMSVDCFRALMDINVTGVFVGTRTYVRQARRQGGGVLINMSSGAAQKAKSGWSAYCASKAAVDRFTEAVQLEEEAHGLRAYAVAPGVVDTEMQALIRGTSAADFPSVQRFIDLKADNGFSSAEHVARHLLELAFEPTPGTVIRRVPAQT